VEWADCFSKVFTDKDFDMTIVSHTEANDIDIYGRPGYYFQYENPEFNKLMAELKVTNDDAKRKEILGAAQKTLAHDVPAVFLFELAKVGVWDAKLQGMWENAPIQATDLTKVKWVD
ncbi:MAG: ABC transporter substrate-binding protein, partial [Rhizobiaceae bacterium]